MHAGCPVRPDEGYSASGPLRSSREGDFLTSPEVSPLFGATLARFVEAEAARIGADPVTVVDAGAGRGRCCGPCSTGAGGDPGWAVEVSPAAREALRLLAPEATVVERDGAVTGPIRGVVLANELADNLPVAVAVRRGGDWAERLVGAGPTGSAGGGAGPARSCRPGRSGTPAAVAEGGLVETQIAAGAWLQSTVRRLAAGAVVVVDYGDTGRRPGIAAGRGHAAHLPAPPSRPGPAGRTRGHRHHRRRGLRRFGGGSHGGGAAVEVTSQAVFLERWGLADLLARRRAEDWALARRRRPLERLRMRSLITGGEALFHPAGLGDFRVLVARR